MFSLPAILSQSTKPSLYTKTPYDTTILADDPMLYFPLHTHAQIFDGVKWGYVHFAHSDINFNSFTYNALPDNTNNPILVKGSGPANAFTTDSIIAIDKSLSPKLDMWRNKSIEAWIIYDAALMSTTRELFADALGSGITCQVNVVVSYSALATSHRHRIGMFRNTGSWSGFSFPSELLTSNSIYHFVSTYSDTQQSIYLNGVLQGTNTWSTSSKPTGTLYIGRGHNNSHLNSRVYAFPVSNFALYDRELTGAEIINHYNAGVI